MTQMNNQSCCSGLEDRQAPRLFKALCDPTRIAILVRLARYQGELTVGQVAECCPIDLSVVSRHLATLRDAGILSSERRGKEVYYSLSEVCPHFETHCVLAGVEFPSEAYEK